ncbi:type II toxin-antitoxin system RelE/ParE family toxin [Nitrococcus mobilis]|uniref:Plasmid stabilization system n=1 Tax=Nitrococcus mobilis Nb-231 TaxID=314278 RepID=A4BU82_9GAMM|nr:type II toxin-antitoxin system RelE/ParE family toxin [Nitrococcus mobilis]EAR20756.1 hypothetical protein NB231_12736 [Nitrococcus mobilis Nb-231]
MKPKPIITRTQADRDVQDVIDYYWNEGAERAALAFIDALERAFQHISRHPTIGSTRYAHGLNLPGLRCWPIKGYPYLAFYVERDDHIDVWRILHGRRDIPTWMQTPE